MLCKREYMNIVPSSNDACYTTASQDSYKSLHKKFRKYSNCLETWMAVNESWYLQRPYFPYAAVFFNQKLYFTLILRCSFKPCKLTSSRRR